MSLHKVSDVSPGKVPDGVKESFAVSDGTEPRRTHKDTVVTSVVSNVENDTRIIGGQVGIRDGSAPCTQHGEPVGTQESVDGKMFEPSKAL